MDENILEDVSHNDNAFKEDFPMEDDVEQLDERPFTPGDCVSTYDTSQLL